MDKEAEEKRDELRKEHKETGHNHAKSPRREFVGDQLVTCPLCEDY